MSSKLEIKKVTDEAFRPYGKVIKGMDVRNILKAMEATPLPEDVVYVPGDADLEACPEAVDISNSLYGGMPVQIGYCNGHNHLLNAVEYHRDSEVNIAATDLILIIGKQSDIEDDFTYDTAKMEAFLVPAGTVVEVFATTLHYAPCGVDGAGFRCVVVLPKGTNTDKATDKVVIEEDKLLFARNKWLIAHPDAGLGKDGAFEGLKGENLSL
ncbi:MAG: DUF4867 family protein [Lachnospiraceae bacterium]|nr:DUF4867 family protein [Lachnospiraceae bacterium]